MGWRTVTIETACKLSYKNGYMLIRGEKEFAIYISDIDSVIIETTQCQITCVLISELIKSKVNIVFCDETHNPIGNLLPFYGCHNSSKRIVEQISWKNSVKIAVFTEIIRQKILNQSELLRFTQKFNESGMLKKYAEETEEGDVTNREGFAAKVYFNALFGKDFVRGANNAVNSALDFGYTVLLSCFNREITSCGYLTQLGIGHKNEFNRFNLSCDFIEPFRVIVDKFVYLEPPEVVDSEYKRKLISLLTEKVFYGKEFYLTDAIQAYIRNVVETIKSEDLSRLKVYEFKVYEDVRVF